MRFRFFSELFYRSVAQSGSASGLGPEGRRFESFRPDHLQMVSVAQLVRASDCGPEGRGFDSHHSPHLKNVCCVRSSTG